jgi:hypothetical protein
MEYISVLSGILKVDRSHCAYRFASASARVATSASNIDLKEQAVFRPLLNIMLHNWIILNVYSN